MNIARVVLALSTSLLVAGCGEGNNERHYSDGPSPTSPSAQPGGGQTSGTSIDDQGGANTGLYVTNDGPVTRSTNFNNL